MVSSIERFHCVQDSQLGPNGVLYTDVYCTAGPHLRELRGNCHQVDLVNVDHPRSTLYPSERNFNLQLANEACSNNQRGFPRMMSLASRHQLGCLLYHIAENFCGIKFLQ